MFYFLSDWDNICNECNFERCCNFSRVTIQQDGGDKASVNDARPQMNVVINMTGNAETIPPIELGNNFYYHK